MKYTENTVNCSTFDISELQKQVNSGIIDVEDLLNVIEEMKNHERLRQHPYSIFQGSDGRYRTYISDASKPGNRRLVAKSSLEAIHTAIISAYKEPKDVKPADSLHLENVYAQWMIWRRDTGTDPKTIKENANDWNRFLKGSDLAKQKVKEITLFDIEDFFNAITKGHAITYKRLSNVRTVLSGVFKYAIRLREVDHSVVFDVDYKQFRTRCKPSTSRKDTYSDDERKAISAHLENKTDIYSLAITFAFRLCLRIGELQVIKKTDVQGDALFIGRSIRRRQHMNDDLTFGGIHYDIDPRIKGNSEEGIRTVTLTPKALAIAKRRWSCIPMVSICLCVTASR